MIDDCLLTTLDNMYDPFTQPDEWLEFDREKGYFSNELLARHAFLSNKLPDEDYKQEVSDAIDRFLRVNPLGIHYKLYKEQAAKMIPLANEVYRELYGEKADAG